MKLEWSISIVAKILDNDMKKCWQNLLKARFQCSMPSAQKAGVAVIRSLEQSFWKGQYLLLPKLDNDAKKYWQNQLKARFECSMLSAQKTRVAVIRSLEQSIWKGQHLLLPKFWTIIWRNADKTFSKRSFSALWLGHRNQFWPEFEAWKNGNWNGQQTLLPGDRFEEMLTKPSQNELSVLYDLGTETSFGTAKVTVRYLNNAKVAVR